MIGFWKWMRRGLVVAGVLVVVALVAASWAARRYLTPEFLVAEIEGAINARVELGAVEWKVMRVPSTLVLRDVKLGERDEWVGKSLEERPAMTEAAVEVKELRAGVSLLGLLQRRVEVKEFVFDEPKLEMVLYEKGGNSLKALFESPGGDGGGGGRREEKKAGSLNVHEMGFLADLDGVAIRDCDAKVTLEKNGMVLGFAGWTAELDRIEVNPAALEAMNTARLRLRGELAIDSLKGGRYGVIAVDGPTEVKLFDPATGDLAPDIRGDLALGEESYLSMTIPAIGRAWEKVGKLATLGLKLGGLPEQATFGRSRSMAMHFADGRLTIEKPLSVWAGDWELAVMEDTWIQMENEKHALGSELVASEKLSGKLRGQLDKAFGYVPKEIRPAVMKEIELLWFREGRLVAEVVSAGALSDPDVTVLNKYPDISEIMKKARKEQLKDLGGSLLKELLEKAGE